MQDAMNNLALNDAEQNIDVTIPRSGDVVLSTAKYLKAVEKPKRGLGRGLDALFADGEQRQEARNKTQDDASLTSNNPNTEVQVPAFSARPHAAGTAPRTLPITALIPSPFQPRRNFDQEELSALTDSIRAHGILQPLLVRAAPGQQGIYEIIGGERRWRAAQLAKIHEVPVIVQTLDDRQAMEIALIENIQRADLTAIEEAEGYERLITEFGHTQEELGQVVGKSRSYMSNILRLLTLPKIVRDMVQRGSLSAGHARLLVGLDKAEALAQHSIRKRMSVRQLERMVARLKRPTTTFTASGRITSQALTSRRRTKGDARLSGIDTSLPKDADVLALEAEMAGLLGLRVEILSAADASGMLGIHFSSLDQLDDLLQKLTRAAKG